MGRWRPWRSNVQIDDKSRWWACVAGREPRNHAVLWWGLALVRALCHQSGHVAAGAGAGTSAYALKTGCQPGGTQRERRPNTYASSAGEGQPPLRGGQGAAPLRARCGAGDLQPLGRPLRPARVRPAQGPATGEAGKVLALMPRVPERLALAVPASGRAPGRPVRGRPNGAGRAPEVCLRLFPFHWVLPNHTQPQSRLSLPIASRAAFSSLITSYCVTASSLLF